MARMSFVGLIRAAALIFCLARAAAAEVDERDVISSVHHMEVLYRSEKAFVSQVTDFADRLDKITQILRTYAESFEDIRPRQGGSEAMHNPITGHLLVRHIALGWPQLKRALDTLYDNVDALEYMQEREDRETLPGEDEMKRSESALIRLIEAYHLDTTKLADGVLAAPSISEDIRSERKLSVWEFGRLTIGLLNQYLFTPSIKLLDAGLKVLQEDGEQLSALPMSGPTSGGATSVIPHFVNEHMRPEDLLSIKYKAMKHHDETLAKVLRGEMSSFGHGFSPVPFNRRKVKNHTAAAQLFRNRFQLKLNEIPSAEMDREQTLRLCRGQELRTHSVVSRLRCRWSTTFPPFRVEEVSLEPHIVLVHQLMTTNQIHDVIRSAAPKLRSTKGGPSMSFKHTALEETVHQNPFVRHLERVLGVKAEPIVHSDLSVVENYGLAGTYGLHSDFRLSVNHGPRLVTSLVYLTDVKAGGYTVFPRVGAFVKPRAGSALLFWNANATLAEFDPLTVHFSCPVVHGNKWGNYTLSA